MNTVRLKRLQADYEAVRRLAHLHPRVEVEGVSGDPPDRYRLVLHVRSLREQGEEIVTADRHVLEITLPRFYPRDAPVCRMLTPVFHPNIAPHAVCVGDHWSAAESLDLLVQRVGEILGFQSYNVKSPLNGRAAQWVEEHPGRVPTDDREFFFDLGSAPMPEADPDRRCGNCGAEGTALVTCPEGHDLCPDCVSRCGTCGTVICLVCGSGACPACAVPSCDNCGAEEADAHRCAGGHHLCGDCVAVCPKCGRTLCLLCDEYPCRACEQGGPV